MLLEMPRTHPYLKGLAETRARADGQCSLLEGQIEVLFRRLEKSQAERTSCDWLIRLFNPQLRPEAIQAISPGQRTRYGERGALTREIFAVLQLAYSNLKMLTA